MKLAFVSKNRKNQLVENPDAVICQGGDGTLLLAERLYPGIPKILVTDSPTCQKGVEIYLEKAKEKILNQEFEIIEHPKLECTVNQKQKLVCFNDFIIRNDFPTHAIRFDLEVNEKKYLNLIGDGLVIATPFGSTAYYNSITRKPFAKGIGIAFNNLTKHQDHLVLDENSVIKIKLNRKTAHLVADNNPQFIQIKENDVLEIKKAQETVKLIKIK